MALRVDSSRWVRFAAVMLSALGLAGCAGAPLPKGAYRVLGKDYVPLASADGYSETGIASWYGADFHGKPTSNGEAYDMYARTCAHKLLPLGTVVRVTNLENGLSAVARINDRGPFVDGRIIDLSYTMACDLGLTEAGTARVRVDAISGPDGTAAPGRVLSGPFAWQVGAYAALETAQAVAAALRPEFKDVSLQPYQRGDILFQRVRVGDYPTVAAAKAERRLIEARGFSPFLVRRD